MTEEEIRPIAEKYVEEFCHDPNGEYDDGSLVCAGIGTALIVARKFEKEVKDLEWQLKEVAKDNDHYQAENKKLEEQIEILKRRIARAKGCMKKLLFIINSEPSNYNCKGLTQDAEDFIYDRMCPIRKQGQHCITEEPCIMCDRS